MLDSLVRSLRPGGWVVIEDFDNIFLDVAPAATPEQAVVRRVALAFRRLLQERGADLAEARWLPDLLRARGLGDVAGEGRIVFGTGGSAASRLAAANGTSQVAEEMIGQSLCTSGELRSALELLADPGFGVATHLLILRPGTPTGLSHSARAEPAHDDRSEPHLDSPRCTHPNDIVSWPAQRGERASRSRMALVGTDETNETRASTDSENYKQGSLSDEVSAVPAARSAEQSPSRRRGVPPVSEPT